MAKLRGDPQMAYVVVPIDTVISIIVVENSNYLLKVELNFIKIWYKSSINCLNGSKL